MAKGRISRHHHALKNARVMRVCPDEIKMTTHITQQDGSSRALRRKHLLRLPVEFPRVRAYDRLVKVFLAPEIIIEQGLVDAGSCGNSIGARAGQPRLGEDALRGRQDSGARRHTVVVMQPAQDKPGFSGCQGDLTNQSVKSPQTQGPVKDFVHPKAEAVASVPARSGTACGFSLDAVPGQGRSAGQRAEDTKSRSLPTAWGTC